MAGLTEALYEAGYQGTTISLISQRASVSKSTFYERFESKDDCFLAAYDAAVEQIRERVLAVCAAEPRAEWALRVRDAVFALLTLLAGQPALASLVLVEGPRAGRDIRDRYQAAVESFVPYLCEGAPESPSGDAVPEEVCEAVVGGVASLLGQRVLARDSESLEKSRREVLEFVLTPFLGAAEAVQVSAAG